MKKLLLVLVSTGFIFANAGATLLLQDGFDYTSSQLLAPVNSSSPGQLNVAYGYNWYNAGGTSLTLNQAPGIASSGLSYNSVAGYSGLQATTGNSVAFDSTQIGSARIQVTPSAPTAGTSVYWSGLLQVNSIATTTVNAAMIGGLVNGTGSASASPSVLAAILRIRVDQSDASKFNIGIAKDGSTTAGNIQWSGALTLGAPYFVVERLNIIAGAGNDTVDAWINPSLSDVLSVTAPTVQYFSGTTSGTDASVAGIQSFNLRNVNTVGSFDAMFDELRYGDSWASVMPSAIPEPASVGLLGFGLLALFGRYLSRR